MRSQLLLDTLLQVSTAFFENLDRRTLVGRVLDAAIRLTQGDRGSVFLPPEGPKGKTKLRSMIATGLAGQALEINIGEGVVGHIYQTGQSVLLNDPSHDHRFTGTVDQQTHYQTSSILGVPLRTPTGRILGVIEILNSEQGEFESSDQKVLEVLALLAAVALETQDMSKSLRDTRESLQHERRSSLASLEQFVLHSSHQRLRGFYDQIPSFAESDSSLLIEGESGTGKEVIARLVHQKSHRSDRPFVAINCAAIPESLFEAELFGVAKGAATGTVARKGKVELSDGGTLFLDEIGELPLSVQAKLLRVLQEKQVQRVGSEESPKSVDFRVVAATNQNLEEMVRQGRFREDLYYRVNVIRLNLPPLRERLADLPELCRRILDRFSGERGWKDKQIGYEAMQTILTYSWPGNIRQLQNKLEGACIASGGRDELRPEDFQLDVERKTSSSPVKVSSEDLHLKRAKDDLEKTYIVRALERTSGNKTQAAKLLGMTREGLRKAMIKARMFSS